MTITDHLIIHLPSGEYANGSFREIIHRLCEVHVEDRVVKIAHRGRSVLDQAYTDEWDFDEMVQDACRVAISRMVLNHGFSHYRASN